MEQVLTRSLAKPPPRRPPTTRPASTGDDTHPEGLRAFSSTHDPAPEGLADSWTDLDQLLAFDGNTDFPYMQNTALQMPSIITAPGVPTSAGIAWPPGDAGGAINWPAPDAIANYQQDPPMLFDTSWLGVSGVDSGAGMPVGGEAGGSGYGQDPWILQHLNAAFTS